MQGSIVRDAADGAAAREPDDAFKHAVVSLAKINRQPAVGSHIVLAAIALVLAPLTWLTRAGSAFLFALIFCIVTWFQMAFSGRRWKSTSPGPHLAIPASRNCSRASRDVPPDRSLGAPRSEHSRFRRMPVEPCGDQTITATCFDTVE